MGVGISDKPWENVYTEVTQTEVGDGKVSREDVKLLGNLQNTSELMLDYTNDPLKDRQLGLVPSHS
jgi:hypothetical protein